MNYVSDARTKNYEMFFLRGNFDMSYCHDEQIHWNLSWNDGKMCELSKNFPPFFYNEFKCTKISVAMKIQMKKKTTQINCWSLSFFHVINYHCMYVRLNMFVSKVWIPYFFNLNIMKENSLLSLQKHCQRYVQLFQLKCCWNVYT